MSNVVIIQARMTSTRLPGKVLMPLAGKPVLGWCVRAAQAIQGIDKVAVATSDDASDDAIASWCAEHDVICVRGPLHDVMARYALAARQLGASVIMRLTADCPLLDPDVCAEVLKRVTEQGADYASNVTAPRTWPQGLDCEAFTAQAFFRAEKEATLPAEREHVTPYLYADHAPPLFTVRKFSCPVPDIGLERWTLDYPKDYAFLSEVAKHLPSDRPADYKNVLDVLRRFPNLQNRNKAA